MSDPSEPFIRGGESSPPGSSPCSVQPYARFEKDQSYIAMIELVHRERFSVISAKNTRARSRAIRYRVGEDPTIRKSTTTVENGVEMFLHDDGTPVFASARFSKPRRLR